MERDADLLRKLRRGKQRALEQIMDRYDAYVFTVIRNVLGGAGSREDAEELTAEVFYALWQHCGEISDEKLRPWLGMVARNRARDLLRSRKITLPMDEDMLALSAPSPEEAVLEQDVKRRLYRAIDEMAEPDREIFLRFYYCLESMESIAGSMNLPLGTVKSKLHRGRLRLKTILTEQEAE